MAIVTRLESLVVEPEGTRDLVVANAPDPHDWLFQAVRICLLFTTSVR
jgi:hypothetical protein